MTMKSTSTWIGSRWKLWNEQIFQPAFILAKNIWNEQIFQAAHILAAGAAGVHFGGISIAEYLMLIYFIGLAPLREAYNIVLTQFTRYLMISQAFLELLEFFVKNVGPNKVTGVQKV